MSALNMAVHFLDWYFHILITDGDPVCAEAKISVWPSNASAETCEVLVIYEAVKDDVLKPCFKSQRSVRVLEHLLFIRYDEP